MSQPKVMRAKGTIVRARFVKIYTSANNSVVAAGANENVFGIAQEAGRVPPIPEVTTDPAQAAQDGENVRVFCLGEECLLEIGSGGCTAGDRLKSGAAGVGIAVGLAANGRIGAIALETASSGELARVQVVIFTHVANAS